MNEDITRLSRKFPYDFNNAALLEQALTHRSSGKNNNERLEYLGDAILGFVIAESLYQKFPGSPEGKLTRLRASLVRKETLALLAKKLEVGSFLYLGVGEKKSGGWRRDSILANTLEALIGAIYLDSNIDTCKKIVLDLYSELFDNLSLDEVSKDPKTELQEFLQAKNHSLPVYRIIKEEGEAHTRIFTVECYVDDIGYAIEASGNSKRKAEQKAAGKVLDLLVRNKK